MNIFFAAMIKDIIFDLSNTANMSTQTYYIGQTLNIDGKQLVVRKVITKNMLRVSYGFDTKGNDVVGIILV